MLWSSDDREISNARYLVGTLALSKAARRWPTLRVSLDKVVSFDGINDSDTSLAACCNIGTVLIEKRNLVVSLVKLGSEDDFIPNRQAYIVIKELIRKGGLGGRRVRCHEGFLQSFSNIIVHVAATDVDDSSMDGIIIHEAHGNGRVYEPSRAIVYPEFLSKIGGRLNLASVVTGTCYTQPVRW
jgi:hypothetical protein